MKDKYLNMSPRIVLTEKSPFLVTVSSKMTSAFGITLLVKPCLSEQDIEILRQDEDEAKLMKDKGFKDFYIILKGGNFTHNRVLKSICERIKK